GQEVVSLLDEDPAEADHVSLVELAVAGRRALGLEQALALEEADLRDRDVGELGLQLGEHFADGAVGLLAHGRAQRPPWPAGATNTSLNLPICSSSSGSSQPCST